MKASLMMQGVTEHWGVAILEAFPWDNIFSLENTMWSIIAVMAIFAAVWIIRAEIGKRR